MYGMTDPSRRYLIRMAVATVVYLILLGFMFVLIKVLPPAGDPWTVLMVLPPVGLFVRAMRGLWEESDEFNRRKMLEALATGFAIGVPLLVPLGIMDLVTNTHIPFIVSFGILMGAWALGGVLSALRYR